MLNIDSISVGRRNEIYVISAHTRAAELLDCRQVFSAAAWRHKYTHQQHTPPPKPSRGTSAERRTTLMMGGGVHKNAGVRRRRGPVQKVIASWRAAGDAGCVCV